jgi:hypothetical protein
LVPREKLPHILALVVVVVVYHAAAQSGKHAPTGFLALGTWCDAKLALTRERIPLPSVVTTEHIRPIFDDSGTILKFELVSNYTGEKVNNTPNVHARNDLREELYFKAFVFPDLSTGSYIVVLIHHPFYQLSFARAGDDKL